MLNESCVRLGSAQNWRLEIVPRRATWYAICGVRMLRLSFITCCNSTTGAPHSKIGSKMMRNW